MSKVSSLPCGELRYACVMRYEDKLLLTGGSSRHQKWSLDLVSGNWSPGPPLTTGRYSHTPFQLANHLDICGGHVEDETVLTSVEVLILTDTQP